VQTSSLNIALEPVAEQSRFMANQLMSDVGNGRRGGRRRLASIVPDVASFQNAACC
jgi:hypothetical protein